MKSLAGISGGHDGGAGSAIFGKTATLADMAANIIAPRKFGKKLTERGQQKIDAFMTISIVEALDVARVRHQHACALGLLARRPGVFA